MNKKTHTGFLACSPAWARPTSGRKKGSTPYLPPTWPAVLNTGCTTKYGRWIWLFHFEISNIYQQG